MHILNVNPSYALAWDVVCTETVLTVFTNHKRIINMTEIWNIYEEVPQNVEELEDATLCS